MVKGRRLKRVCSEVEQICSEQGFQEGVRVVSRWRHPAVEVDAVLVVPAVVLYGHAAAVSGRLLES